jgi:hypothetical protein
MASMKKVAKEAGMAKPDQKACDDVMRALDTNRSNSLTLDEFKVLIRTVLIALKDV